MTVLGASGDDGSTDFQLNLEDLYTMQVNSWPSSDPLVTSVGGTQMNLDDAGQPALAGRRLERRLIGTRPRAAAARATSSTGPTSRTACRSVVGDARGTPDISLNAAVDGGVWVYYTFVGADLAVPHLRRDERGDAGVRGHRRDGRPGRGQAARRHQPGALLASPYGGGLVDVTQGNNDIGPFTNSDGNTYHVPGFAAGPGYDLASGLGTLDAAPLRPGAGESRGRQP